MIDGDAYAGEALMERLKPGEERLISFALDLGTSGECQHQRGSRARIYGARHQRSRFRPTTIRPARRSTRSQTRRTSLASSLSSIRYVRIGRSRTTRPSRTRKTARYYRFRVPLGPHQKVELPVTEHRALMDSYALVNFSRPDLELFIARNYIDAATRATLEKILDVKSRMTLTDSRIEAIDKEVVEIGEDQGRLRDNIKALTATAEARQLISRYVSKADTQETRLEQLNKDKKALNDERASLQGELEAMIRGARRRSQARAVDGRCRRCQPSPDASPSSRVGPRRFGWNDVRIRRTVLVCTRGSR